MTISALSTHERLTTIVKPRNNFEHALSQTGMRDVLTWSHELIRSDSPEYVDYLALTETSNDSWQWLAWILNESLQKNNFFAQSENQVTEGTLFSDQAKAISREAICSMTEQLQDPEHFDGEMVTDTFIYGLAALNKVFWMLRGVKTNIDLEVLMRQAESQSPESLVFRPDHTKVLTCNSDNMSESNSIIRLEYLLRGLFNQWIEGVTSEETRNQLAQFYNFISSSDTVDIHGAGAKNYTDRDKARDILAARLSEISVSPNEKVLVVGVGDGSGPDVSALRSVTQSDLDGIDIVDHKVPDGINFTKSNLHEYPLPTKPYDLIVCTGSSLLNERSLTEHLQYWQKISALLDKDGNFLYEVGALDSGKAANYLYNMAVEFNLDHPSEMFGVIGRRAAYRRVGEDKHTFGANIFPEPITTLFAQLAGLTLVKAERYQTKPNAFRTLYSFSKNRTVSPFVRLITSIFADAHSKDSSPSA